MNTKVTRLGFLGLISAAAFALVVGKMPANATVLNNIDISKSVQVDTPASFNDQTNTSDPDLSSFAGVNLSVLFKFEAGTTENIGIFSALVENNSDPATTALMTAIGINIRENLFTEESFLFTPKVSISTSPNTCNEGGNSCAFSSPGTGLNGFVDDDISASNDAGVSANGNALNIGEKGLFEWTVSFSEDALDGLTLFTYFFEPQLIENTLLFDGTSGTSLNAFWVAHMQSIDNYEFEDGQQFDCSENDCDGSLKIGGAITGGGGDVPEPGTLALFGIGLVGLSLMRRRRKAA